MKMLVAIPCIDTVHTEFARSLLSLRPVCDTQFCFSSGSLVYDSRNNLAVSAIEGGFDRVLWLDSDMSLPPELIRALSEDLDGGRACVGAMYSTRKPPFRPCVYRALYMATEEDGKQRPVCETVESWPEDELFEAAGIGFGAVMMTTELLEKVRARFGLPFSPILGFGEDLSFCLRATQLGEKIWCDPRIRCGHIGLYTYSDKDWRPPNE